METPAVKALTIKDLESIGTGKLILAMGGYMNDMRRLSDAHGEPWGKTPEHQDMLVKLEAAYFSIGRAFDAEVKAMRERMFPEKNASEIIFTG